jgi:GT2 family glycosyltransferase
VVAVDVSVVTFRPDLDLLAKLFASIGEQSAGLDVGVLIHDNSPEAGSVERIRALAPLAGGAFARVEAVASPANVGFGRGHNANAARSRAPFLFVLNQDCILEPGVLAPLLALARRDDARVAAWELRQIPYEHPKAYDPATLDAPWVSGAATLFRRAAFDEVGGFEPRIFMYGEDVDLSWRLRGRGWRLRYVPRLAVVHRTYREAAEVKPLQVLGGVATNLALRARFGGISRTLQGLAMAGGELLAPQDFPGRRAGIAKAIGTFLLRWPYFARTRVRPTSAFRPIFSGWNYELRRDGAFLAYRSLREAPRAATPRVSILIRTVDRPAWLAQALSSVAEQTWPNVEAVVIEDGPERSREVIERFRDRLPIVYRATGEKVGRARAGNLALASATGEWLNFLDDDDLLFADHVETLVEAVTAAGAGGGYALAWETATEMIDRERAEYRETAHVTRHRQPFDRLTLWHHNYLPIQAVLFHRRLYDRHGGFAEDMDQLEDWNLWTRYTLDESFVQVEKTTSIYRVPAGAREAAGRQELLDLAYRDAVERQRAMQLTLSPREISQMAEAYVRSQTLLMVARPDVRRFIGARPWLSRLASFRQPVLRRLRRPRSTQRG